jgi:nitrogen regulatory protein P-II 2
MKLITAIVRPDKLDELIGVVADNRGRGLTVTEVRGFGRQHGRLTPHQPGTDPDLGLATSPQPALLPKVRLEIAVLDEDAEPMVEAIAKHARTDTIGDGKIWVTNLSGAMRIRTGQRDCDAL